MNGDLKKSFSWSSFSVFCTSSPFHLMILSEILHILSSNVSNRSTCTYTHAYAYIHTHTHTEATYKCVIRAAILSTDLWGVTDKVHTFTILVSHLHAEPRARTCDKFSSYCSLKWLLLPFKSLDLLVRLSCELILNSKLSMFLCSSTLADMTGQVMKFSHRWHHHSKLHFRVSLPFMCSPYRASESYFHKRFFSICILCCSLSLTCDII
jgi:hypothetical protein